MKRFCLLVGFLAVLSATTVNLVTADEKPEAAAQKATESWLALVDASKYSDSWEQAATSFRSAVTKPQWETAMHQVREPLGRLQSRQLKSATFTKELPNAPAGEYVVIQYTTVFDKMPAAVETVTPMRDRDGTWRVSGYFIKPAS